jgi:ADP-ribose pyrophosphatase YjhB (NUDIX family)
VSDGGRVLLMKRAGNPHKGTWAYPGGSIEPGETAEQAARREVREECGYDYTGPLMPLGVNDQGFQGFAARVPEFAPSMNAEHSAATWASFDRLPSPRIPGMKLPTRAAVMPLIKGKSDETRSANIKKEIEAGKDPKQAAAIAYRVQREAGAKDGYDVQAELMALCGIADRCMK